MSAFSEGAEIRRQRTALGWKAERFCQEIRVSARELGLPEPGVDAATVSRWERGKRSVSDRYRRLIDHTFARTLEAKPLEWRSALLRRDFLRHSATTAGLALTGPFLTIDDDSWDRLSAALQGRVRVDTATVTSLEGVTTNLTTLFASAPPIVLRPLVDAHLSSLTRFLEDGGTTDPLRRRLASSAAETLIIAGWIAADGINDSSAAQHAYLTAIDAARVAEDAPMAAYAIASASCLPIWRTSPEESVRLLTGRDDVNGFRATDATPNVRAWIGSLLAEAELRAGNESGALAALDLSEKMLDTDDPQPRPKLLFFSKSRLDGERGVTATRLSHADTAIHHLDLALAAIGDDEPKLQCRMLNHKAAAVSLMGDVDGAVDIALGSLEMANASGSRTSREQIVKLARQLPTSSSVRDLREALTEA
jgi:transcriptional regulator with XRE-family HTH domain